MNSKAFTTVFVAVVLVILLGQTLAYGLNPYNHDSSCSIDAEGNITYSVTTNTSSVYRVAVLDNGGEYDIDHLICFEDSRYASMYKHEYIAEKNRLMMSELILRNSVTSSTGNAEDIEKTMEDEISSGEFRTAILMTTGVFPDLIYDGTGDSLIFDWLSEGGTLFWLGAPIGKYFSSEGSEYEEVVGFGSLFFGKSDDVVFDTNIQTFSSEPSSHNDISLGLNVNYNHLTFGINVSEMSNYRSIGYTGDGYESMVFLKYHGGSGMIVNIGGDISTDNVHIVAQMISAGVSYKTELVDVADGVVKRTTIEGSFERKNFSELRLYIYLGTPTTFYAKGFDIQSI